MKTMNIIFLDIDGVLNTLKDKNIDDNLDIVKIKTLKRIIRDTGANIIISSDWKHDEISLFHTWNNNNTPNYMWITPDYDCISNKSTSIENKRVIEIKEWIKKYNWYGYNINYVVIDDMNLKIDNFIKTDPYIWLTEEQANDIIKMLNK